jgi:hypothetical protein
MAEGDLPIPGDDETGQQISTESSLSNWAGDYVTDMLGQGQALANQPYEAYGGTLTAGPSDLQTQAFGGIAGLTLPDEYGNVSDMGNEIYDSAGALGQYDPLSTNPNTFDPMTGNPVNYDPLSTNPNTFNPLDYNPGADYNQYQNGYGDYQAMENPGSGYNPYENQLGGYNPYENDMNSYEAQQSDAGDFQSGDISTEMWNNQYAQQYMNPFVQQALNPQLAEIQRQAEMQRQVEQGQMTQAGAYGGSRSALMNSEMDDNMLRLMSELTGEGYQNAYESAGNMFTSDYQRDLQAQVENENARQYAATMGLDADRLNQADRQFGANLGLEGQRLAEQSRQYGSDLDYKGQQMAEQSRQFGANMDYEGALASEKSRQYGADLGLRGDTLSEQSNQFGANLGLEGERLAEQSQQYGAGLDMEGSRLMEQSNQFGAGLGLDALQKQLSAAGLLNTNANNELSAQRDIYGDQLDAGAQQRLIDSEGIAADQAQFEQERDYPYQQVQYMHSLLGGMPLATQNYNYAQPSTWSDMMSGAGGMQELYDIFFPSGGTPPTTTDGTNSGNTGTTGTDPDNLGG